MCRKLKTQDKLKQWEVGDSTDLNLLRCALCKVVPDSHEHLFFECSFSSKVWKLVTRKAGLQVVLPKLTDITSWLLPISLCNSIESIVSCLVFAASSYYIWQERNNRLYSKDTRREEHVCDIVMEIVRLKMTTIRFKKTQKVVDMLHKWNISTNIT